MRLTREGKLHFIPGHFTLGRFSKPLHILSIIWLSLLSLVLMFPSTIPVTRNNFNYAPVVLVILTIIFAVSWYKARTDFTGGAKDVSRASHRMPVRSLEDIYPRKSPLQLSPGLTPRSLSPFHQPPSEEIMQRFKSPLDKTVKNGVSASGHNKVLPEQAAFPRPSYPTSLTPPRRDPMPSSSASKKQHHHHYQRQVSTGGAGATSRSSPRDQPHGQTPNLTMNTITSVQSHPDSILGIPLSESPEMMHRELTVHSPGNSSSSPSSPSPPPLALASTRALAASGLQSPDSSAGATSGLFLTRPFGPTITITDAIVPEISIAPPTTNSSTIESVRATPRHHSPPSSSTLASRAIQKATTARTAAAGPGESRVVVVPSQQAATSETSSHPLSAIGSIFKLGQGLSNMFASGKTKVTATMNTNPGNNNTNRLRTGKDRAPTPYPSSLVDPTEDSAVSDYAVSMEDDPRLPFSPKSVLKLSPPSPPLPNSQNGSHDRSGSGYGGNGYTVEDIVNNTNISLAALPSISQFPTLDGYPLIKSPSTMDFGVDVSGGDASAVAEGRRQSNTAAIRPLMLPLSRTPTIQATSQAYTHISSLNDDGYLDGQLAEADESYENEYHHDYPVISISNNRLKALSPTSGGAGGLFRLPNRDIEASSIPSLALTPSGGINNSGGGIIHSSSLLTYSTGPAATPTTVMAPTSPNHQQHYHQHSALHHNHHNQQQHNHQSSYAERHDPIERLLLLKAQQEGTKIDPTSQQQLESVTNPALQFLQRTRTVANWAQEQSRIQEKRARHYARTRALKELRKRDPTATLSVRSSSGSSFSDFSSLSSFSTSTSSSASASSASTSKFVPQSPQQHRRQQHQHLIQSRTTPPPTSLSSPSREKLVINTNLSEDPSRTSASTSKMPSFPRHFASNANGGIGGLVIDPTMTMMMEDIQLDQPTRLEMLIHEEDEVEDEEPGLYIDTDDVLSPSMEIESLGAGVGRL